MCRRLSCEQGSHAMLKCSTSLWSADLANLATSFGGAASPRVFFSDHPSVIRLSLTACSHKASEQCSPRCSVPNGRHRRGSELLADRRVADLPGDLEFHLPLQHDDKFIGRMREILPTLSGRVGP